jgi:hypothetical protein
MSMSRIVPALVIIGVIFLSACGPGQPHDQWPIAPPTGVAEMTGDVNFYSANLVGNSPDVRMTIVPREDIGDARGIAEFVADEWERDGWDVSVCGQEPVIVQAHQESFSYVAKLTACNETVTACEGNPAGAVYVHVQRTD